MSKGVGMRRYQVISADGHVEVPLEFSKRVPTKYRDVAPRLVVHEDGTEWWHMGQWTRDNVGNLYCGLRYDEFTPKTAATYHNPDGSPRPGTGDAVQRLKEQDQDGIDAEVLYPPVYMGGLIQNIIKEDKEAYLAMIRAYNTFLAEEYCALAPDRLIGNAMVPVTGVEDAIAETERCKKLGLRSVSLSAWPNGGQDPSPEDDRFWAAALDMDVKLSPHGGFGGRGAPVAGVTAETALTGSAAIGPSFTIGRLILHGVFDRFPKIKFYFAETQAAWLAHLLNWMDEFYLRWYTYHNIPLKKMPSQYYREHCRFSFIHDRMAMELRKYIGIELLMWGTDFPHSQGTFPDTRRILGELFEGVPEHEKHKVLVDNVCEFFDLDPEKPLTPTP
jgi:predicted TIM-barrel fold metal-dependent hydrolase